MLRRLLGVAAVAVAVLAVTVVCALARAETLEQALADAYLVNPALNAERARLRAIDEQVAFAKSGLWPNITGSADTKGPTPGESRPRGQYPR
jgi:outer membrane protein